VKSQELEVVEDRWRLGQLGVYSSVAPIAFPPPRPNLFDLHTTISINTRRKQCIGLEYTIGILEHIISELKNCYDSEEITQG
jgi:hypothetical protein